jgi:hypothetical protein
MWLDGASVDGQSHCYGFSIKLLLWRPYLPPNPSIDSSEIDQQTTTKIKDVY